MYSKPNNNYKKLVATTLTEYLTFHFSRTTVLKEQNLKKITNLCFTLPQHNKFYIFVELTFDLNFLNADSGMFRSLEIEIYFNMNTHL